jgi:DNA-binding CsgD family transcriptional regulator
MGGSENVARSIEALAGLTAECRTRTEYELARHEWLQRAIGFDTSYIGATSPDTPTSPKVSGISAHNVSSCEAQIDRYWRDLFALNAAAERAGGAVHDQDVFSARARERMPFYREVVRNLGIRATAASVLKVQGQTLGCLYLGRTSRGARFDSELGLLRRALPVLSLGRRLFEHAAQPVARQADARGEISSSFTRRERQLLTLLAQGLTNRLIAARLGSSPFTVKNQISTMLAKAGVKNRAALVYVATHAQPE